MQGHYAAIAATAIPVIVAAAAAGCAAWMSSLSHSLTLDIVMLWHAVERCGALCRPPLWWLFVFIIALTLGVFGIICSDCI